MANELERFTNWIEGDVREPYNMIAGNSPGNVDYEKAKIAIEIRLTRELVDSISHLQSSIDKASESSKKLSRVGIGLTVIIAILTVVLVVQGST